MEYTLRPYQEDLVKRLGKTIAKGADKVICQSPTGSGKTVIFTDIIARFLAKGNDKVLIAVHIKELRKQAARKLREFGIENVAEILPGSKTIKPANVYVGLVQTLNTRYALLPNFDMVIIDECHQGNFKRILKNVKSKIFIGFSATPLTASKRDPLKNYYKDIVLGEQIETLIEYGALAQNYTYAPASDIDVNKFRLSRTGDFREDDMEEEFRKQKNVLNTLRFYEKKCKGKKTIIFNVNIAHSLDVYYTFKQAGYNVQHVDGKTEKRKRKEIFKWFDETKDAILCNVGIATMGFDQPDIECVIVNRSTISLPLWLQMCGRGSRIAEGKSRFTIIDLGYNARRLGNWCDFFDWEKIFWNPKKHKEGVAPTKSCPECDFIMPAATMQCPECEHEFERENNPEQMILNDLELITSKINMQEMINFGKTSGYKPYYPFFQMLARYKNMYKKHPDLTLPMIHEKAKVFYNSMGKRYTNNRKRFTIERLNEMI